MKIGCFANCLRIGGAEKVAAQLIGLWKSFGHETVLITAESKAEREYECAYVARETLARQGWVDAGEIQALYEKYRFNVVVFNGGISLSGFGDIVDWFHLHGVRVVMILHHTANNWMYTLGSSEDLWVDDAWRKIDVVVCVNKMWALWWKHRGVNAVFIQNPVSVSSGGSEGLGGLEGSEGLEGLDGLDGELKKPLPQTSQTSRTYKPITLVKNVDEAVERLRGKKNIIWVGRLNDPLKRPELAIEVFARLAKEGMWDESGGMRYEKRVMSDGDVGEGIRFVMLGDCSNATEKRLRKLFTSLLPHPYTLLSRPSSPIPPPPSLLSFPGFVTNVGDYLAKADAHLFTSATEVTVPQVILEANVAGVPTVAFDIPVLRDERGGMGDEKGGMGDEIKEKWRKVLDGETIECDFDSPEVYQRLMDELQFSQQWFASHYLPTLRAVGKWKARLNPQYLMSRLAAKLSNH